MLAISWFSIAWIGWALVLIIGFTVLETIALRSKRKDVDTLSRNIQWLVTQETWIRWITLFGWGAFAVWFGAHIWGSSL